MTTSIREYDAAQTLLTLRGSMDQDNLTTNMRHQIDIRAETPNTGNLSLSCTIMDVPRSNLSVILTGKEQESNKELSTVSKPFENVTSYIHKKKRVSESATTKTYGYFGATQNTYEKHVFTSKSPPSMQVLDTFQSFAFKDTKKTREMATQTEESHIVPLKSLKEHMMSLRDQLKRISLEQHTASVSSENYDHQTNKNCQSIEYKTSVSESITEDHNAVSSSKINPFEKSNEFMQKKSNNKSSNKTTTKRKQNSHSKPKDTTMIPIGEGKAMVPAYVLDDIKWNSYTSATRKLLEAVFERHILATHSLTGKRSPAFPNRAPKKRLNPALVNDIVQTVVERCSVPENIVRTSITTKCADECKMSRTQPSRKRSKTSKKNCENIPPTSSEQESGDD